MTGLPDCVQAGPATGGGEHIWSQVKLVPRSRQPRLRIG
jgi:hypothetical protein